MDKDIRTILRELVDSHSGEVEVEGCMIEIDGNYCDIRRVIKEEGKYFIEYDDTEKCEIRVLHISEFRDDELKEIYKYAIK